MDVETDTVPFRPAGDTVYPVLAGTVIGSELELGCIGPVVNVWPASLLLTVWTAEVLFAHTTMSPRFI